MPKFRVKVVFNGCEIYEVNAKTADEASDKVFGRGLKAKQTFNDDYSVQSVEQIGV